MAAPFPTNIHTAVQIKESGPYVDIPIKAIITPENQFNHKQMRWSSGLLGPVAIQTTK
jgi:hypothetical protein